MEGILLNKGFPLTNDCKCGKTIGKYIAIQRRWTTF